MNIKQALKLKNKFPRWKKRNQNWIQKLKN